MLRSAPAQTFLAIVPREIVHHRVHPTASRHSSQPHRRPLRQTTDSAEYRVRFADRNGSACGCSPDRNGRTANLRSYIFAKAYENHEDSCRPFQEGPPNLPILPSCALHQGQKRLRQERIPSLSKPFSLASDRQTASRKADPCPHAVLASCRVHALRLLRSFHRQIQ